jgi:hypothetical protein
MIREQVYDRGDSNGDVTMFPRIKRSSGHQYLQIVENYRENGVHRQRLIVSLGRLEELQASGDLDALTRGLGAFCIKVKVVEAHREGAAECHWVKRVGPSLVFERLWRESGIPAVIGKLLADRKYEFPVERAIFLTVLHRLFGSGSDRNGQRWLEDYVMAGTEGLTLQQMYRAMAWLGEELKDAPRTALGKTSAPRCIKDLIEEELFARRRDLFSGLDMVFFDTTSLYFEGEGGQTLGQHGHSKDHRGDLKQMVAGMIMEGGGHPLCCELWPGNTTDAETLVPVAQRLRERFWVDKVCLVADRGMVSKKTMEAIESMPGMQYLLGVRLRNVKEVRERVLKDPAPFETVYPESEHPKDPSPLEVKEVKIDTRRYLVCRNADQAKKDAADRETIVAKLREALNAGDLQLVGNRGYRKFLQKGTGFAIDEAKITADAQYDGLWVLRSNTALTPREGALKYKELWMVEDLFRTTKSVLETRPIWHKCDETIRGHVFCTFLALLLKTELFDRLAQKGKKLEWGDIRADLDAFQETALTVDGTDYRVRPPMRGTCHAVFAAVGVAPPPAVQ